MLVRTYVKRLRMEAPLRHLAGPAPPRGFALVPWSEELLESHADVKWLSFRDTLDASIFPNLSSLDGCIRLMRTIAAHPGFVPEATWLAHGRFGYCGCIQGVRSAGRAGMIQNLAVIDECRGRGIGRALLAATLIGFRNVGLLSAQLEVSARNTCAVRLYENAGFRSFKTFYRETKAEFTEYAI
jgi:ribosomal protein S18 acetylase RimI-like enzyme